MRYAICNDQKSLQLFVESLKNAPEQTKTLICAECNVSGLITPPWYIRLFKIGGSNRYRRGMVAFFSQNIEHTNMLWNSLIDHVVTGGFTQKELDKFSTIVNFYGFRPDQEHAEYLADGIVQQLNA